MNPRIIITSPYPEFAKKTKKICCELSVKPIIINAILEDAVQTVLKIVKTEDIEVVVSRGATSTALMNFTHVPVITADADAFDILQALWDAKKISPKKIAFLGSFYHHGGYDFESFQEILGTTVKQYLFKDFNSLQSQIYKAYGDGMEVLVTGSELGVNLAREIGMNGIILHSSNRSIIQAIERAKEVIRIRRIDREYTQRLSTLMNSVKEAVLLLDEKNHIMLINDEAKKILKITDRQITSKHIKNVNNIWLDKVYGDGSPCFGTLEKIDNINIVINRVHVKSGAKNCGSVISFQELIKLQKLEQKTRKKMYKKGLLTKFQFKDIIGESSSILETIEIAKRYGKTDSTILIHGESGTGKELFAQSIHQISLRKNGPFVAVNCAALPENLLESELFGYEEGAFTGAKKGGKIGLFELAHGGTIFLDEIGKIPLSLQGRLLRVLQEKEVMHLGGDKIIPVDCRVIAATNVNLEESVQKGEFQADLYYRINVLQLRIPPLRERRGDGKKLFSFFIDYFNKKYGKQVEIPSGLESWINSYSWPGNVRELTNFVERMVVLSDGKSIDPELVKKLIKISENTLSSNYHDTISVHIGTLDEMRKELVDTIAKKTGYNQTKLAKRLGISRNTLTRIINS